jgi:hypothetical protein
MRTQPRTAKHVADALRLGVEMLSSLTGSRARQSNRARRASETSSLKWFALFAAAFISASIWVVILIALGV